MKRQIRRNVFETNSSSTHSLTMCSEKEFDDWKAGKVLFDEYKEQFVSAKCMTDEQKRDAEREYQDTKDEFHKNWCELSEEAKDKYYSKYAIDTGILDEDAKTYEQYMYDGNLESFVYCHTTEHGDKVVAFGEYGYDG